MPTIKADLITHPMRARILTALMGRQLTTQQLAQLLPDVPLPSLYRHLRLLAEAEIVESVDEVRVNGALTKVYAVRKGQARIAPEEVRDATQAEHLRHLTTFLNVLADSFRAYLEQEPNTLDQVPLHSLMESLHLSPEEYRQFCEGLHAFLQPWRDKAPDATRQRLIFAHILLPDRPDPPLS